MLCGGMGAFVYDIYLFILFLYLFLQEMTCIYSVLSAVLLLGNIEFSETEDAHHTLTEIRNKKAANTGKS